MLHILTCSPWKCDIDNLVRILQVEDDLLLLQDGVLAAVNNNYFIGILENSPSAIFALKEDLEARGLVGKILSRISIVDYTGFVNLVVKNSSQMYW